MNIYLKCNRKSFSYPLFSYTQSRISYRNQTAQKSLHDKIKISKIFDINIFFTVLSAAN